MAKFFVVNFNDVPQQSLRTGSAAYTEDDAKLAIMDLIFALAGGIDVSVRVTQTNAVCKTFIVYHHGGVDVLDYVEQT